MVIISTRFFCLVRRCFMCSWFLDLIDALLSYLRLEHLIQFIHSPRALVFKFINNTPYLSAFPPFFPASPRVASIQFLVVTSCIFVSIPFSCVLPVFSGPTPMPCRSGCFSEVYLVVCWPFLLLLFSLWLGLFLFLNGVLCWFCYILPYLYHIHPMPLHSVSLQWSILYIRSSLIARWMASRDVYVPLKAVYLLRRCNGWLSRWLPVALPIAPFYAFMTLFQSDVSFIFCCCFLFILRCLMFLWLVAV